MKRLKILLLCVAMVAAILPLNCFAYAQTDKLAIISSDEVSINNPAIDILLLENFDIETLSLYKDIAVSESTLLKNPAIILILERKLKDFGGIVYLYGTNITLRKYSEYFNIDEIVSKIPVYGSDHIANFDFNKNIDDYYCIIGYSKGGGSKLLAGINGVESDDFYMHIIMDHYLARKEQQNSRSALVKGDFDIREYVAGFPNSFVNMDYYVYKDTDEIDNKYDYFALRTNIQAKGSNCNIINVSHNMLDYNEIIDAAPNYTEWGTTVGINIPLGVGTPSLTFSFNLNSHPNIFRTMDAINDKCSWSVVPYNTFLGIDYRYLENDLFNFASSWATLQNGTFRLSTTFDARFIAGTHSIGTNVKTYYINYNY